MEIEIVEARRNMAQQIAAVHISSWQCAYKGIIPDEFLNRLEPKSWSEKYKFGEELGTHDYFFAVKANGEIIGLLYLCRYRDEDLPDSGEIGGMYLAPEHWHMGYGRNMMEYSLDFLKHKGYHVIYIWVMEKNILAKRFYEKFGFIHDGKTKYISLDREYTAQRYYKHI